MKKLIVLMMSIALIFALSACGGGSKSSGGGSDKVVENSDPNPTEINIVATNWQFDQESYTVAKGEPVKFTLENKEGYHGYEIKGLGIKVNHGDEKQVVINEPGEYKIVCSIMCGKGHNDMVSTLIVQ